MIEYLHIDIGNNHDDDEDDEERNVFLACRVRPRETNYDAELVTSNYTDPMQT